MLSVILLKNLSPLPLNRSWEIQSHFDFDLLHVACLFVCSFFNSLEACKVFPLAPVF